MYDVKHGARIYGCRKLISLFHTPPFLGPQLLVRLFVRPPNFAYVLEAVGLESTRTDIGVRTYLARCNVLGTLSTRTVAILKLSFFERSPLLMLSRRVLTTRWKAKGALEWSEFRTNPRFRRSKFAVEARSLYGEIRESGWNLLRFSAICFGFTGTRAELQNRSRRK